MEVFFKAGDGLARLLSNLKKNRKYKKETRQTKINEIKVTLATLKRVIGESSKLEDIHEFKKRYLHLKGVARKCIEILEASPLDETALEIGQDSKGIEEEEEEEEDVEESEEEYYSESDFGDKEVEMASQRLDLGLALKLIKPFEGAAINLQSYIESIELLRDYSENVPEKDILKFLKTTLVGAAHGAIDNSNTIEEAFDALRRKFSVKITPKAVEKEMFAEKQKSKTISDFGAEMEKLSAKLAAAHVSMGTFASEAAAVNIVEPIAVQAFTEGLKDPSTNFFIKARNPPTLNRAISDALECLSGPGNDNNIENMMALWCTSEGVRYRGNSTRGRNGNWRGRGNNSGRGFSRGRGNFRGRGYQQYNNRNHNHGNNNYRHNANNNYHNNHRGHNNYHMANVAEQHFQQQPQQQQQQQQLQKHRQDREEVHTLDLFR